MIEIRPLATLELSAASGLLQQGPHVFVVADDEHFLDAYAVEGGRRVARVPLGAQLLPEDPAARKRLKPDLEALAMLPGGQLLALGSGSTPLRCTAFLVEDPAGGGGRPPRAIDLAPLYRDLGERFPQLNIEGAAAAGPWLRLLQRGNGAARDNAIVDLDLAGVLEALGSGGPLGPDLVRHVRRVSLGELDGVPLGFTDASPLDPREPRIAFVAAAEATDDPYVDGACAGSVLGVLDASGRVAWSERIEGRHKMEGVVAGRGTPTLLVADPDDRAHPASLFAAPPVPV